MFKAFKGTDYIQKTASPIKNGDPSCSVIPALASICCHHLCWKVIVCFAVGAPLYFQQVKWSRTVVITQTHNGLLIQCRSCKLLINCHHANLALLYEDLWVKCTDVTHRKTLLRKHTYKSNNSCNLAKRAPFLYKNGLFIISICNPADTAFLGSSQKSDTAFFFFF